MFCPTAHWQLRLATFVPKCDAIYYWALCLVAVYNISQMGLVLLIKTQWQVHFWITKGKNNCFLFDLDKCCFVPGQNHWAPRRPPARRVWKDNRQHEHVSGGLRRCRLQPRQQKCLRNSGSSHADAPNYWFPSKSGVSAEEVVGCVPATMVYLCLHISGVCVLCGGEDGAHRVCSGGRFPAAPVLQQLFWNYLPT